MAVDYEESLKADLNERYRVFGTKCYSIRDPQDTTEFEDGDAYVEWLGRVRSDMVKALKGFKDKMQKIVEKVVTEAGCKSSINDPGGANNAARRKSFQERAPQD